MDQNRQGTGNQGQNPQRQTGGESEKRDDLERERTGRESEKPGTPERQGERQGEKGGGRSGERPGERQGGRTNQ